MGRRRARAKVAKVEGMSVEAARPLLGKDGRPAARHTVLSLALRGEVEARRIAGRLVITTASVLAYRARRERERVAAPAVGES